MHLIKEMKIEQRYLNIAVDNDAPPCLIRLTYGGTFSREIEVRLAKEKIDFWAFIDLMGCQGEALKVECTVMDGGFSGSVLQGAHLAGSEELYHEKYRPQFHFTAKRGWIGAPLELRYSGGRWRLFFEHDPFGCKRQNNRVSCAESKDLIHWKESEQDYALKNSMVMKQREIKSVPCFELTLDDNPGDKRWVCISEDGSYSIGHFSDGVFVGEFTGDSLWSGHYTSFTVCPDAPGNRCIQIGLGQGMTNPGMPFSRQFLIPMELRLKDTEDGLRLFAAPVRELQNLRVWKRSWSNVELTPKDLFCRDLDFKIAPGKWPDIRVLPAEGTPHDITSDLLEFIIALEAANDGVMEVRFFDITVKLNLGAGTVECRGATAPLHCGRGGVKLRILVDRASVEIFIGDGRAAMSIPVNLQSCRRKIELFCDEGSAKISSVEIFGLRGIWPTETEFRMIERSAKDNPLLYQSESYRIFGKSVEDDVYGEPPAYVPDRNTILSPVRAVEEFAWRDGHGEDMTRVIDRGNVWHPGYEISDFPAIFTGHNTIDAACRLAADVFSRCASDEFSRPGEEGLWSAGQFQGPGEGFGVWVRDTAHVAIRMGNLLDPQGARRTLLYTTMGGFDNGVDGIGMPIVGICDYFLATGDLTLVRDTWRNLRSRIARLGEKFDSRRGLITAEQSTSNDAFPEPECGGFSLATESYFMEAFRAMARMGGHLGEEQGLLDKWAKMGGLLLENIRKQYWKESAGFFTSGPIGSISHLNDYWESSGQEMALWPRYGIASGEQRARVLERLAGAAMNEFGVNVFPYRRETNHFCNAAWVVWTAGMAAAAGREGMLDLLLRLIVQQVRNCLMNKTFYEVIDFHTGRAWRWPGQLWHAAGFLSYFYLGVLGLEYDERGLYFSPAVPELLSGVRIENFSYRKASLNIVVHGWGTHYALMLDGTATDHISAHIEGSHLVELFMH